MTITINTRSYFQIWHAGVGKAIQILHEDAGKGKREYRARGSDNLLIGPMQKRKK